MDEKRIPRLRELAKAAAGDRAALLREFTMRVPAEPDRDADLVLSWAADALEQAQGKIDCAVAIEKGAVKALSTAAERIEQLEAALKKIESLKLQDDDRLSDANVIAYKALQSAGIREPGCSLCDDPLGRMPEWGDVCPRCSRQLPLIVPDTDT